MAEADEVDPSPEAGEDEPGGARSRRHGHTDISERAGELLRTNLGVWLAAAAVNVATLLTHTAHGILLALPVGAATLVVASLGAWAAGRLEIGWDGVALKHGSISLRRIAAVGLAVFVASVATAVVIWLVMSVIGVVEAPRDPRAIPGG